MLKKIYDCLYKCFNTFMRYKCHNFTWNSQKGKVFELNLFVKRYNVC